MFLSRRRPDARRGLVVAPRIRRGILPRGPGRCHWVAKPRFRQGGFLTRILLHVPLEESAHLPDGNGPGSSVQIVKRPGTLLPPWARLRRRSAEILGTPGQSAAQPRQRFEQRQFLPHRHVMVHPLAPFQKSGHVLLARWLGEDRK